MSNTPQPWRTVFSHPEIEFTTTHGFTRAVEAGKIDAEFSIRGEINARKHVRRYYDETQLPTETPAWVSYQEAVKLLAMGSRHPNKEGIGSQQMSNLLDDNRIDARVLSVHPKVDTATEMTMTEARQVLGRATLLNCIKTGEIRKRQAGVDGVLVREDVMNVAQVLDEWITRPQAAELLGLSDEAVRRWLMRNPDLPTRPYPGLPKKQLILREAVLAKAEGRAVGDEDGVERITLYDFASFSGVPVYRVRRAIPDDLPAKKVSGSWMIDPNDPAVQTWAQSLLAMDLPPGDWMTAPEAAVLLGLSAASVYAMCRQHQLPSARKIKGVGGRGAGGKWYIERSDIDAILAGGRHAAMVLHKQAQVNGTAGTPSKFKVRPHKAELMPEDFTPVRSQRTNTHPAWELAKSNPNRWVRCDLKEQTLRSEASTKNGAKKDLPGLWSVSKQGSDLFISYIVK